MPAPKSDKIVVCCRSCRRGFYSVAGVKGHLGLSVTCPMLKRKHAPRAQNVCDTEVQQDCDAQQARNVRDAEVQQDCDAQQAQNVCDAEVQQDYDAQEAQNVCDAEVQEDDDARDAEQLFDAQQHLWQNHVQKPKQGQQDNHCGVCSVRIRMPEKRDIDSEPPRETRSSGAFVTCTCGNYVHLKCVDPYKPFMKSKRVPCECRHRGESTTRRAEKRNEEERSRRQQKIKALRAPQTSKLEAIASRNTFELISCSPEQPVNHLQLCAVQHASEVEVQQVCDAEHYIEEFCAQKAVEAQRAVLDTIALSHEVHISIDVEIACKQQLCLDPQEIIETQNTLLPQQACNAHQAPDNQKAPDAEAALKPQQSRESHVADAPFYAQRDIDADAAQPSDESRDAEVAPDDQECRTADASQQATDAEGSHVAEAPFYAQQDIDADAAQQASNAEESRDAEVAPDDQECRRADADTSQQAHIAEATFYAQRDIDADAAQQASDAEEPRDAEMAHDYQEYRSASQQASDAEESRGAEMTFYAQQAPDAEESCDGKQPHATALNAPKGAESLEAQQAGVRQQALTQALKALAGAQQTAVPQRPGRVMTQQDLQALVHGQPPDAEDAAMTLQNQVVVEAQQVQSQMMHRSVQALYREITAVQELYDYTSHLLKRFEPDTRAYPRCNHTERQLPQTHVTPDVTRFGTHLDVTERKAQYGTLFRPKKRRLLPMNNKDIYGF